MAEDKSNSFVVTLSKERHEALRRFAVGQGVIAAQHGEIEAHGVKLAYSIDSDYHPQDGSTKVEITVLHKPHFVPEGIVEHEIEKFIDDLPNAPEAGRQDPVPDTVVGGDEPAPEQPLPAPVTDASTVVGEGLAGQPDNPSQSSESSTQVQEQAEVKPEDSDGHSAATTSSELQETPSSTEVAGVEADSTAESAESNS